MQNLSEIQISTCKTHHLHNGQPIYQTKFIEVMKFHSPGLAPVKDCHGAYHIDVNGNAAYAQRYDKTFGFYHGLAAVVKHQAWMHINEMGISIYPERYLWCGNYQENYCVVKSPDGYYHIDRRGHKPYSAVYDYAGDFKDGIAVVAKEGLYAHIIASGEYLHEKRYLFLDIYHKGYARARDERGWFHIDYLGYPIYNKRFAAIEPFYNDLALVQTFDNGYYRINVLGDVIEALSEGYEDSEAKLSSMLVSFWQSHTISAAVSTGILESLPENTTAVANNTKLSTHHAQRLLRALWELGIVSLEHDVWQLTKLGKLLAPNDRQYLAAAAIMWQAVNREWDRLPDQLTRPIDHYHTCFKDKANVDDLALYQRALTGYAENSFRNINNIITLEPEAKVFVTGSCSRAIIPYLRQENKKLNITLYDSIDRLRGFVADDSYGHPLTVQSFTLVEEWPVQYDIVIFPRYLHYWPDSQVTKILQQAKRALTRHGKIYIIEMLLNSDEPSGALLDLNMLVETGGRLRTQAEWSFLTESEKLQLISVHHQDRCLTYLEYTHVT